MFISILYPEVSDHKFKVNEVPSASKNIISSSFTLNSIRVKVFVSETKLPNPSSFIVSFVVSKNNSIIEI